MKCKYKYCKNNGEVLKENAVKIGNSYYCKDCYEEKNNKNKIENIIINKLPTTPITMIRKVINQLIIDKGYDINYILFIVLKIKNENSVLNNPFGLLGYCSNNYLFKEWQLSVVDKKFSEMKCDIKDVNCNNEEVIFTFNQNKKWTDII